MSQSSQSSSPTGAALATASHLAARPVPAIAAVPPSSSSSSSTAAGAGVSGVSKTADVDVDVSTGSTSAPLAAAGDGAATTRPGVGPRQNSKKELMESAHLLCSLFGGGGAGGGSGSGGSTSPPRRAAGADEAVPPPAALVRHRSKGPLKKRMLMPVLDDADDNNNDDDDDDSDKDEGHGHGSAATRAKEEDGPTGLKTAVVAAVATQRQSQQQKETSTAASSASALTTGTTGTTGATGTPTGDYCTVLYTPGEDELYLSPQLCLTRAQIEAFEARPADVSSRRSAGGRSISRTLTVGQVGLRCIHCKHLTLRDRSMSAVHYPGSIRLVYQSVRNFQRNHFLQCRAMPQSVKDEFQTTRSRFVQSKGRSHVYWAKSCAEKGMVDTPDGGIRFNVDAAGAVVPADPDSAVEATEAFMAQNASRGPAARKRKAERDGSNGSNGGSTTSSGEDDSGGSGGKSTNKTGKDKTTERKKKKKRASKKTVAAAPAAAVAARGTAAGAASDRTGVTVTATAEVGIAAKPSAAEPTKGKEESPYATAVLVPPSALAVTAAAPGPAPTALVAASSASSANPSVEGVVVAPPAPALTAQVSLDAEQLLRRQLQEYQQQQQQQFSSQPGQTAAHPGQESALAQADRIIRASLLEQEQQRQRQLLAAQLSGQYHPQHLQQLPLTYNPAPSPTLAAASAPAGAAASSAASLLRQQQQQEEIAASLGLGLPESAATAATAAMQKQQQQQQQQQIPAAASASSSPGATANAATRAEYLVYLETLDRMSASINAAQNLQAAYRTNPTVVGRLQYLAANDEMAAHMHRAKIQAMNLQRIRLESRLSDLNASLCVALQGGGAHAAPALAAAGAGVGAGAGASAEALSPNSLLRQVSE